MILPLDKLISKDGNIYQLTCAVIKRAAQITIAGDKEVEEENGKVVSVALRQILTDKIEYQLEEE